MRSLASVAPVAEQPNETPSKKGKHHKNNAHKEKRQHDKAPKHEDTPAAQPQSEPPTVADPVESLPADKAEQDESGKHGDHRKEHGDEGKGHGKK